MNRITVYINGNPGFKPAIITKLGRGWIHRGQDMDGDTISFPLPEKMSIEEFKAVVGIDIISDFGVSSPMKFPTPIRQSLIGSLSRLVLSE
jgi:hypothetical protein